MGSFKRRVWEDYSHPGHAIMGFFKRAGASVAGAGGETNTASNVGVGGIAVFKQKTGVDLEFKSINVGSTKLTIANDAGNNEIDLDVDQTKIDSTALLNAIKTNLIATVAPVVTDDSASGYSVLSRWADVTADKEYVCLDASVGAAVWIETTGGGGGITESSGNWTPTLQDSSESDAESQAYTLQDGKYIKHGDIVFIQCRLTMSNLGTLSTGERGRIAGLPFTSGASNIHSAPSFGLVTDLSITALSSVTGYIQASSDVILLEEFSVTQGTTALLISQLFSSAKFFLSATYRV